MTDKPIVTPAQFEIWMEDPTTKKYLDCLDMVVQDRVEHLGDAEWVDKDPDINQGIILTNLGERSGLTIAVHPEKVFIACDMLVLPAPKVEGEEDGA